MKKDSKVNATSKNTNGSQKNNIVFLKGKKTVLRPVSEKDILLCVRWLNDPEIRQKIQNVLPVTEGGEREWLESLNKKSNTNVVLTIVVKGKAIGIMGIHNICWTDGTATTGAFIGEKEYQGKGYGTDAKMALLNYAFNTLNLRKIKSEVKSFNTCSLKYSKKCGYKPEGCLKKHCFANGKYWDVIILGLFKEDWLPYWKKYCENNESK
jgi:RimJ/RimL family protein N-acetyltransferase